MIKISFQDKLILIAQKRHKERTILYNMQAKGCPNEDEIVQVEIVSRLEEDWNDLVAQRPKD